MVKNNVELSVSYGSYEKVGSQSSLLSQFLLRQLQQKSRLVWWFKDRAGNNIIQIWELSELSQISQHHNLPKFNAFSKEIPLNMTLFHEIDLHFIVDGQHPAKLSQILFIKRELLTLCVC